MASTFSAMVFGDSVDLEIQLNGLEQDYSIPGIINRKLCKATKRQFLSVIYLSFHK